METGVAGILPISHTLPRLPHLTTAAQGVLCWKSALGESIPLALIQHVSCTWMLPSTWGLASAACQEAEDHRQRETHLLGKPPLLLHVTAWLSLTVT